MLKKRKKKEKLFSTVLKPERGFWHLADSMSCINGAKWKVGREKFKEKDGVAEMWLFFCA